MSELKVPRQIELEPGEKMILLVRQHWFVFRNSVLIMFFIPFLLLSLTFFLDYMNLPGVLRNFLTQFSLYGALISFIIGLSIFLWKFYLWHSSFYVTTDRRLIVITQHGLFSSDDRQASLSMVQDVRAQINGIIPIMYGFGDVAIQVWTDDKPMVFNYVPKPKEVQQAIMRAAMAASNAETTTPNQPKASKPTTHIQVQEID